MNLAPRIIATADTCSGHPRIEGTRIRVSNVLGWIAAGMSLEDIAMEYPPLTPDDIRACLDFAAATVEAAGVAAE